MITAIQIRASERTAKAMLQLILDIGQIDDEGVLCPTYRFADRSLVQLWRGAR